MMDGLLATAANGATLVYAKKKESTKACADVKVDGYC
jgi:hypothetical protein